MSVPSSSTTARGTAVADSKAESHRIYWQQWISNSSAPSSASSASSTTWVQPFDNTSNTTRHHERHSMITSSVAVRISPHAIPPPSASDVTAILRDKLHLPSGKKEHGDNNDHVRGLVDIDHTGDALVLVGTLYSLPRDYIQYEHESVARLDSVHSVTASHTLPQQQNNLQQNNTQQYFSQERSLSSDYDAIRVETTTEASPSSHHHHHYPSGVALVPSAVHLEPFHLFKTLAPTDNPLHVRDRMERRLHQLLQQARMYQKLQQNRQTMSVIGSQQQQQDLPAAVQGGNSPLLTTTAMIVPSTSTPAHVGPVIAPKLQWYYVPGTGLVEKSSPLELQQQPTSTVPIIPNCVELDGYCTSMEEENEDDEEEEDDYEADDDENSDQVMESHPARDEATDGTDLDEGEADQNAREKQCLDEHCGDTVELNDDGDCDGLSMLLSRFPWLKSSYSELSIVESKVPVSAFAAGSRDFHRPVTATNDMRLAKLRNQQRIQDARYYELSVAQATSMQHRQCVTGFLLRRSNRDRHLWRRMYCVLTDDHLWYVSRIYTKAAPGTSNAPGQSQHRFMNQANHRHPVVVKYAKHGRIRLTRALLLEPTTGTANHWIPYSFELVSLHGQSQIFRAQSKCMHRMWLQALSDRILQAFENSLIAHPALIIADACKAQNRRMLALAAEPLLVTPDADTTGTVVTATASTAASSRGVRKNNYQNKYDRSSHQCRGPVGDVLRWGMDVAEYRECCRYILSLLPSKRPVVVLSPNATATSMYSSVGMSNISTLSRHSSLTSNNEHLNRSTIVDRSAALYGATTTSTTGTGTMDDLDPILRDMIYVAWGRASDLLARATHVALRVQSNHKRSSSVETLCRHADYVITGRFRNHGTTNSNSSNSHVQSPNARPSRPQAGSSTPSSSSSSLSLLHRGPPPVDLFDPLLVELQSLATRYRGSIVMLDDS